MNGSTLAEVLANELSPARICRLVVAVSDADAKLIEWAGHPEPRVLGHAIQPAPSPAEFAERDGLLFVGSLNGADSPNYDGLVWFLDAVLPLVQEQIGNVTLTVAGHVHPSTDTSRLAEHPSVRMLGGMDDLGLLHGSHRVFVAPTRFAAGIPYKIHEAASRGIPVVATSLLCGQLGWHGDVELLDGGDHDPVMFAHAVVAAYSSHALWQKLRNGALEQVARDLDPEVWKKVLAGVIAEAAKPPR